MQGKIILFICALLAGVYSCSTDVELNAPYESRTVVFGLLDPGLDTQWVKINRTWLGEGNNLDIAGIRDSSEYPAGAFSAVVEEWVGNSLVQSFPVIDTLLENKDQDGIFYAPEHTAYYFLSPNGLSSDANYRLNIDFAEKVDVEATTNIIASQIGAIAFPPAGNDEFKFNFASVTQTGITNYINQEYKWTTTANAKRYEARLKIYFTEFEWADEAHTELIDSRLRVLEWFLGTRTPNSDEGGETMKLLVNGEGLYRFLAANLDADSKITREFGVWDSEVQITRAFDFVLTIANDELDTYLDINAPVTNIAQERPSYTNVVNGLGLWASRAQDQVEGVGLSEGSIKALVEGEFTADLNFCSSNPFNDYYCGN